MLIPKKTQKSSVPGVLTPPTEKQQNYGSMVHHSYGNLKEHGPERTFFKQLQDRISTLSRMKQVVSKMLK